MGRALGIGASSPFVVFPCYSVIDCSSLWAGFCYPRHEEKPLNRAAPFRFAFLSAFSVPRSKHPPPFGRTLSFPKSASRLSTGADSLP